MPRQGQVTVTAPDASPVPHAPIPPAPPVWGIDKVMADAGVTAGPETLLYGGGPFSMSDAVTGLLYMRRPKEAEAAVA